MSILIVVPVRLGSKRLPRKVLLDVRGAPMFVQTVRVGQAAGFETVVATSDEEVLAVAEEFGLRSVYTEGNFENGSVRSMAAARLLDANPNVLMNLQADEPNITPEDLQLLANAAQTHPHVATLVGPRCPEEDRKNPHVVKAIVSGVQALYFTRASVPLARIHIGAYAFSRAARERITDGLPRSPLAEAEDLEQLAWLEAGLSIAVCQASHYAPSINTPDDLRR